MTRKPAAADARIVLAIGKEQVLVGRAIDSVIRAARAVDPEVSRVDIEAGDESAAAALAGALSPSLFGDSLVVVVSGLDAATDAVTAVLTDSLSDLPGHVRLVGTHPGGTKGKRLLDALRAADALEAACGELKGRDLEAALAAEFARYKRKATSAAIEALTQSIGTNLGELLAAVGQLCSDTAEDPITDTVVSSIHGGIADVKGWDVANAMWDAKPAEMLEQFRWAIAGDSGAAPAMISSLSSGLRTLVRYASAPAGMREAEIVAYLGVPGWRIRRLAAQKARWTPDQLAAAARLLALADRASKGTVFDPAIPGGRSLDAEQSAYEMEKDLLAVRPPRG